MVITLRYFPPFRAPENQKLAVKMANWGILFLTGYLIAALITPVLIGLGVFPDTQIGLDSPIYSPPSFEHWCGTDRLGRDVCVRTLQGTSVALQVVFLAVGLAVVIGVPIGIVSGYMGGLLD